MKSYFFKATGWAAFVTLALWVMAVLAFWAGLMYVAVHYLLKFW